MINKFEMSHFFIVGMIVFSIVLIAGFYNMVLDWERMRLSLKVSELAMKFFYCALIMVFHKNYLSTKVVKPEITEEELDEITKEK